MKDGILGILVIVGYISMIVGSGYISHGIVKHESVFGYFVFFVLWGIVFTVLQALALVIVSLFDDKK